MSTREGVEQELEWRRCKANPVYFMERYWHISIPGGSPLFELRSPQLEALGVWEGGDNTISLKARQIGWSTLAAAYAFWKVFFHSDETVVMLSRTENFAKKLLQMSKYGFNRLPEWMQDRGPGCEKQNLLELNFVNGSSIESMASRENAARGITASLIIADEWAFFNDPAEAWTAIYPATEVGGQIIGISTANGFGNWFHKFYESAKAGTNNFVAMFFAWDAVPGRDGEWYKKRTKDMEPWQLSQEYPTTDEEAFIASGNPVYDTDMLKQRIEVLKPEFEGRLAIDQEGGFQLIQSDAPNLRTWERPQADMSYAIGADIAAGGPQGDYSTACVIKVNTGRVVAMFRDRVVPEDFAELLDSLGRFYNKALLAPERNTHGLVVVRRLMYELNYPNLYLHTRDNINQTTTRNAGWHTNGTSKPVMVDELGAALRRGEVILHDDDTLIELMAYSRKITSNGHETYEGKPHDDLVIALAIANMMRPHVHVVKKKMEEEGDGLTMEFFETLAERAKAHKKNSSSKPYTAGYKPPKVNPGFIVHA